MISGMNSTLDIYFLNRYPGISNHDTVLSSTPDLTIQARILERENKVFFPQKVNVPNGSVIVDQKNTERQFEVLEQYEVYGLQNMNHTVLVIREERYPQIGMEEKQNGLDRIKLPKPITKL